MSRQEQGNLGNTNRGNQEAPGKPHQELTVQVKNHEQGQSNLPEQQNWFGEGLSHEQLVQGLRGFIQERGQQLGGAYTPEEIIHSKLQWESGIQHFQDETLNKERTEFFSQLRSAWDALAYDRYEPGSLEEQLAGATLSHYTAHTRTVGGEPVIRLSPIQTRIIDALTETVGIPHTKRQAGIAIPDKLKNYSKFVFSKEYQDRVAQARAKQRK